MSRVEIDESGMSAIVHVPEDQLSLAIGRRGQNVRLASKLTGFRIDIAGSGTKKAKENQDLEITESEQEVEAEHEESEAENQEPKEQSMEAEGTSEEK